MQDTGYYRLRDSGDIATANFDKRLIARFFQKMLIHKFMRAGVPIVINPASVTRTIIQEVLNTYAKLPERESSQEIVNK